MMSENLQDSQQSEVGNLEESKLTVSSAQTVTNIHTNLSNIQLAIKNAETECKNINDIDQERQEEISRLIILLQGIEKIRIKNLPGNTWIEKGLDIFCAGKKSRIQRELEALVNAQQVAMRSLLKEKPDLHLAKRTRIRIERIVNRYNFGVFGFVINQFTYAKHSESVPLKVCYGLITALLVNVIFTVPIVGVYTYREFTSEANEALEKLNDGIEDATEKIETTEKELVNLINQKTTTLSREASNTQSIATAFGNNSEVTFEIQNLQQNLNLYRQKQEALRSQLELERERLELEQGNIQAILHIVLAITAGTLGSVVSILIRIEEFQNKTFKDRLVPFFIGAFKPIIGASFGVFLLAIINSEIVVIPSLSNRDENHNHEGYFIFVVAFIAGFSERFAKDIVNRAEDAVTGSKTSDPSIEFRGSAENKQDDSKSQEKEEKEDNKLGYQSRKKENTLPEAQEPVLINPDTSQEKRT